ncbi:hypothetical protein ADICEAN_02308 [Cesiribacter andamanensis AMV16]|uniref:Glycosyl hydrolase-like 10 domain-containing protein n=2 Tax=Cesiribacter TaxID=1133570 RepID=M7N5P6_9BACT|nr:hypothetical protein ADICEAN_02308 [Cesiribacter andamanensis AMV16]
MGCSGGRAITSTPTPDPQSSAAVRGVWLTNVASQALDSRENIREAVALCQELGFNSIFVVTWNRGYSLYPSQVVAAVTGTSIMPRFQGRDPLQELLEEATAKNIKVFAWFEFGFSASYGDSTGGLLLQRRPEWASRDRAGKITEKNGFQWMNAFHPEVQQFIKDMVLEVVRKYPDLAGIQGDDRLPALPSNGGYDAYTVALYQQEHGGNTPPAHETDYDWIKWRSRKLTLFLKDLVEEVRRANPQSIISMSPSIYPWSEENYLQDWPAWQKMGLVDLVIPQVYRYAFDRYQLEMDKILQEQLGPYNREAFYPGVLLQVDTYNPSEAFLKQMIDYNRAHGVQGEVFFFYEGIKKFKDFFKREYGEAVPFPEFKRQYP